MSEEKLSLPEEIPWKLVSTTQPLSNDDPDQTTISMFVFVPDEDKLSHKFHKERLIYVKFTVTVSPANIPDAPQITALGEGVPCFHLKLDLKVRKASGDLGTIRPYFHSAAPIHRTMVQSGVAGAHLFEGEADAQFMGKSGSQMYESSSSRSRTTSEEASLGLGVPVLGALVSVGGSVRNTSTSVSAQRAVSQIVDTTEHQASQERRELTSHTTKVENVLTLLNGKYIGTPYLSFSLNPRPLQLLSLDPSDPSIWFSQLLQRRSSGIEGIQEFSAVIFVPKGEDFCVNAKLRRVCVLDNPPGPLTYSERFNGLPEQYTRLLNYLNRSYPPGTPLDDLDVDITDNLIPIVGGNLPRPSISAWNRSIFGTIVASVISPAQTPPITNFGLYSFAIANYKNALEVWLETLRDEYEHELSRSPLERGILLGEERILNTCLSFDNDDGIKVTDTTTSVSPLFPVPFDPSDVDIGGVSATTISRATSAREQALQTITRWNLLEDRMATILANQKDIATPPPDLRFDNERMVMLLIDRWAKLNPKDVQNLSYEQVIKLIPLSEKHRKLLKSAGATDLRSIAWAIKTGSEIDKYNVETDKLEKVLKGSKDSTKVKTRGKIIEAVGKPMHFPISAKDSAEICQAIGKALQDSIRVKAAKKK
jgi:hypothetical protein